MASCIAPMTCWIEPEDSPWQQSTSVKVCQRTKRAKYWVGNFSAREHRSEQTTGRHTGPSPKQTSFRKWGLCWRKRTNPATGLNSCLPRERLESAGLDHCCKRRTNWLQLLFPQSIQPGGTQTLASEPHCCWKKLGPEGILHSAFCILHFFPPGPRHFNKEQTPLGDLLDPNPRFHGGCFGVWGHTSSEALNL